MDITTRTPRRPTAPREWLRRAGRLGFFFFFIKGLAWLLLPLALWLIE